jgi:hypothetical protein
VQRLARITDRTGHTWADLTWSEAGELLALSVPGATVHPASLEHPVLGAVAPITNDRGDLLTVMSAIDWARPAQIPAIAEPGRLPAGAGGVILNVLALLAPTALRYAGPWPTSALYQSLLRSFTTTASEAEFTAGGIERALRGARDVLPFEFLPAPHERIAIAGGHVEIRDGLERAVIDGVAYGRDGGVARLVGDRKSHVRGARSNPEGIAEVDRAEVWFGDAPWAEVATFAADGSVLAGPHPLPACTSDALGKEFPPALREAIAELVAEAVPAPLAHAARAAVIRGPIVWADLGAHAARRDKGGFAVHGALWERLAPSGLTRVALAIAEALVPVVTVAVVADVGVMSQRPAGGAMVKP